MQDFRKWGKIRVRVTVHCIDISCMCSSGYKQWLQVQAGVEKSIDFKLSLFCSKVWGVNPKATEQNSAAIVFFPTDEKGKTASSITKICLYRKPVHASPGFNPALSTSKNNAGKVCKVCRNMLYSYLMIRYLSSQSNTCNAIDAVTKSKEDPLD